MYYTIPNDSGEKFSREKSQYGPCGNGSCATKSADDALGERSRLCRG